MQLFFFPSLSVVLLLRDVSKTAFLVNQNGGGAQAAVGRGTAPLAPPQRQYCIERQKFKCDAIFCEIYVEKWMFDRSSFAKQHFQMHVVQLEPEQLPPLST